MTEEAPQVESDVETQPNSLSSSASQNEGESWLDQVPRRRRITSHLKSPDGSVRERAMSSTRSLGSIASIERRSSMMMNSTPLQVKKSTSFARKSTFGVKGTIFHLEKNQFADFPELAFKPIPEPSVSLDKRQLKEYDSLIQEITKERDQYFIDRDQAVKMQQKREEKIMKEFQEEMNARVSRKLQDFERDIQQLKREKKQLKEILSKEEVKKLHDEFDMKAMYELSYKQEELENRLIKQRLKWLLPWLQKMASMEQIHLLEIQSLEIIFLEESQRAERLALEEKEAEIAKLDFTGFEKELKQTRRERKMANRSMSKDEIEWEKEVFQKTQSVRFEENMKKLEEAQAEQRISLDATHEMLLLDLENYYKKLHTILLEGDSKNSPSSFYSLSSFESN